jgi:hypothetical protein
VLPEVRGHHCLDCAPLAGADLGTGHQVVGPVGCLFAGQDLAS